MNARRYIEVARAAVWSLGRLAAHTLTVPLASSSSDSAGTGEAAGSRDSQLSEAWPLLSDPVLRVVVSMLQSCHLQVRPRQAWGGSGICVGGAGGAKHTPG